MQVSTDTDEDALAEVIQDLQPGDRIVIHEIDCAIGRGEDCDCEVILLDGPSGKA